MNYLEGNRLIAEFMGRKFFAYKDNRSYSEPFDKHADCVKFISDNNLIGYVPELGWELKNGKYHTDWDWLMPVVEKIQSIESGRFGFIVDPWSMEILDYKETEARIVYMEFIAVEDPLMHRFYEMA